MKDLKAQRGAFYIARLIAEGEHETQDFKFAISDARKIARSLSAFANHKGGRLLVGVKDNGSIAGLRTEEDIYVIEQAAEMYCRPPQQLRFSAFAAEGGAIVLKAEIDPSPTRPVQAQEPDGHWRTYIRVADENIVASPLMVRSWKRIKAGEPQLLSFSNSERMLLDMLAGGNTATVKEFMFKAHISQRAAEEIAVSLYAVGAIDWRHHHDGWRMTLPRLSD